jgi:flavodoxin
MKLKPGVNLDGVSWRLFYAAVVAEEIYKKFGAELVITSANDGKHGDKTLHHKGLALDLRTWNLGGREMQVAAEIRKALGKDFDVIVESDHIHLEYQPKTHA